MTFLDTQSPLAQPLLPIRPIENPIVMFDMDGTLLDLGFDSYFWLELVPQHYAHHHGLTREQAQQQLMIRIAGHRRTLNWYSLDFWSTELELDLFALKTAERHKICLRPHALAVLEQLKQAGIETWLVTNADPFALQLKLEETQIRPFFNQIVCSHQLSHPKESVEFWQSLQQQYIFDKNRAILVDDNDDVLTCAGQFGIAVLLSVAYPDTMSMERHTSLYPMLDSLLDVMPFCSVQ